MASPECIAVVMDGNRRWAKEQSLPPLDGHKAGREKLKEMILWCKESGVPYVIAYGFSTENWKRTEEEVSYLMNLLYESFTEDFESFKKEGVRVKVIGERDMLSDKLKKAIEQVEHETKDSKEFTLVLAVSYGGRKEILSAVNKLKDHNGEITEEVFSDALYTEGIPDPDLMIRAGGEHRLSNFLPWQSVYTELYFTETYWPALSREEFDEALLWFRGRDRRRGGDPKKV